MKIRAVLVAVVLASVAARADNAGVPSADSAKTEAKAVTSVVTAPTKSATEVTGGVAPESRAHDAPEAAVSSAVGTETLPAAVPGYELRQLDIKKTLVLRVDGRVVETHIPVFVYFPTELGNRTDAVKQLRGLYDTVVMMAGKQAVAPSDLRDILVQLDAALLKLEAGSGKPTGISSAAIGTPAPHETIGPVGGKS